MLDNLETEFSRRWLKFSLLLAVVYDGVFGLLILFAPEFLARLFRVEAPKELMYLKLNAVFLFVLILFYGIACLDLEKYSGNVVVAITGRFLGGIYFAVWVLFFGASRSFLFPALGDVFFGVFHWVFLPGSDLFDRNNSKG